MQESVFDQMAQSVEVLVIFSLYSAVFLGWDDDIHVLRKSLSDDLIAVITLVCEQPLRSKAVNQRDSLLTIVDGTRSNKYSDRHTIRIHGQMYLGVEPPFVRSMSWFPPTAPAAWG